MLYCNMFAILVLASSPNSVDGYSFIDFMNVLLGTPTTSQFSTFTTSSTPTTTTGCVTSDGEYACGEFFKIEDKNKKICMFAHCSDLGLIVLWEAFPCYPYDISMSNTVSTVPPQSITDISSTTHNEPQKSKNQSETPTIASSTFKVFTDTTSYMRQEIDTTTPVSTSTSVSSPTHNERQGLSSTSTKSVTDTTSIVTHETDTTTPESTSTTVVE